ncbi:hypothetical protein HED22_18810 [Thalassospira sp. HF15]|uniref:TolB family protein n=1 Tax=Thalassospira sp. HF15 TaxID=2722755 RepID=UPI00142F9E13|nr:PD40 domain-containing protein [Thalassospira sp. HF15]NIY77709.1 hypothetical protein [Thalassospira sp. HF15]
MIDLTRFKRMILRAASISITVIGLTHLQACAMGQYPSSAESEVKFHFGLMDFTPDNQMLIFEYVLPNGAEKVGFYFLGSKERFPVDLPSNRYWSEPAVSPDGRYLALTSACVVSCLKEDMGAQIALIDLSNSEPNFKLMTTGPGYKSGPVFTNNGKHIVYAFGPDNGRSHRGLARVNFDGEEEVLQRFDDWGIVRAVRHAFFDSHGNYYAAIYSADSAIRKPLKKYRSAISFPVLYKFRRGDYKVLDVVEFAKETFISSPSISKDDEIVFLGFSEEGADRFRTDIYASKDNVVRKILPMNARNSFMKSSRDGSVMAIISAEDFYSQKDIYIYRPSSGLEKTGISDEIIADLQP